MFELFIEFIELPAVYPLYISIVLAFAFRVYLDWNPGNPFTEPIRNRRKWKIKPAIASVLKHSCLAFHSFLTWLTGFIRRKYCPDDDDEGPVFLLI